MKTTKQHASVSSDGQRTSGENLPYWLQSAPAESKFESLKEDLETDILVIGGGIAGLTTAYCLAHEGKQVILIEDGYIGSGESGRTTGHLSYALDDRYYELERIFGEQGSALAANSHMTAIQWISRTIKRHQIECHFKEVDGYLFLHPSDTVENLEKEYHATHRAGLMTEMMAHIPGIKEEDGHACIRFPYQARFHIMLYLQGLAKAFIEAGGRIYTQTRAEKISKRVVKANGHQIQAEHIVVATNVPVNNLVSIHTKQWPYRTYVIGAKVQKGSVPVALGWDSGDQDTKGQA
jgi:glycine/D-amino acid oxidase-like deaminating enzyme